MNQGRQCCPLAEILPNRIPSTKSRVCIVTQEFLGLNINGGIGTFFTRLAESLAAYGHHVTVLYAGSAVRSTDKVFTACQRNCLSKRITLDCLEKNWEFGTSQFSLRHRSYKIMRWLEEREMDFDIVHFPDWEGMGYYPMLLKRQSISFANTIFVLGLHGPSLWGFDGIRLFDDLRLLDFDFMESECVRLADVVYSHNQYMVDWVSKQGWALPECVVVQKNVAPLVIPALSPLRTLPVRELVFFGRREERKGIVIFCDAVERSKIYLDKTMRVTFLGKDTLIGGVQSHQYLRTRTRNWKCSVKLVTPERAEETLDYLQKEGRLAVIPSLIENSPYTIVECLCLQIPFIASDVGGIPELIMSEDRRSTCVAPHVDALAQALVERVTKGVRPSQASFDFNQNREEWCAWHSVLGRQARRKSQDFQRCRRPLVSVVVVHFDRPAFLQQALESLYQQTYTNFEVVLVDGGSTTIAAQTMLKSLEPKFSSKGWKIVYDDDNYLGASRNFGARHARGEYLLFMDDDNYAKPDEIDTFVAAALKTGADILTCANEMFCSPRCPNPDKAGRHIWLPLGPALAAGVFDNVFGDANALIRKSSFEAVGGFSEDVGIGNEDWEFFARAVLHGLNLQVVPRVLFWYRNHNRRLSNEVPLERSLLRSLRPYLEACPASLRNVFRFALGAAKKRTAGQVPKGGRHAGKTPRTGKQCRVAKKAKYPLQRTKTSAQPRHDDRSDLFADVKLKSGGRKWKLRR